jgi:hypothetical protein
MKSQFGKVNYVDFGLNSLSFYVDESSLISLNYKSIKDFHVEELQQSVQVWDKGSVH